jgi:uncharacterized protein (TIGR03000 family)
MCLRARFFPTVLVGAVITFLMTGQPCAAQYVGDRSGLFPAGVIPGSNIPGAVTYAAFGQAYGGNGWGGGWGWGWPWGTTWGTGWGWGGGWAHRTWGWGWGVWDRFGGWGWTPYYATPDWLYSEPYYYSAPVFVQYYPPINAILNTSTATDTSTMPLRTEVGTVQVLLPADGEVWLDGKKTEQTGTVRVITTPPLSPGQIEKHALRVAFKQNGQEVNQTVDVQLQQGSQRILNFMPASANGKK